MNVPVIGKFPRVSLNRSDQRLACGVVTRRISLPVGEFGIGNDYVFLKVGCRSDFFVCGKVFDRIFKDLEMLVDKIILFIVKQPLRGIVLFYDFVSPFKTFRGKFIQPVKVNVLPEFFDCLNVGFRLHHLGFVRKIIDCHADLYEVIGVLVAHKFFAEDSKRFAIVPVCSALFKSA